MILTLQQVSWIQTGCPSLVGMLSGLPGNPYHGPFPVLASLLPHLSSLAWVFGCFLKPEFNFCLSQEVFLDNPSFPKPV